MDKKNFYILSSVLLTISITCLTYTSIITANSPKNWWVVLVALIIFFFMLVLICVLYFSNVEFICPKCKKQFKPRTFDSLTAIHVSSLRYLKCPNCKEKYWCKETWNIKK